jgi:cell wall-associated NlpC family hydrolase
MMDPRLLACNGRVASLDLQGKVQAERFVEGWPQQVSGGLGNLCSAPAGALQRQLYPGEQVTVYDEHAGWSFVKAHAHGYVGYIKSQQLQPLSQGPSTHYISVPISHSYRHCDMKSGTTGLLVMGSQLQNLQEEAGFMKTQFGWVPKQHVKALTKPPQDPVALAKQLLGAPYLWGGDSALGIDCSGLIRLCHMICTHNCPADSDLQQRALGTILPPDAPLQRGDLIFWKGHVAMMVNQEMMIHASAHQMSVTYEPLSEVISRIALAGEGDIVLKKRLLVSRSNGK